MGTRHIHSGIKLRAAGNPAGSPVGGEVEGGAGGDADGVPIYHA